MSPPNRIRLLSASAHGDETRAAPARGGAPVRTTACMKPSGI